MIITIDGTAASGKSTVGALLAQSLGYLYFDTGVMYRAVTWAALDRQIAIEAVDSVSQLAEELCIEVKPPDKDDGRQYTVLVDGRDVTWQIRSPAVEATVSQVASYPRVRQALTAQQRRIASRGNIVMVGRDIGTVVVPEAELKIFLEASPAERARRRYAELTEQGQTADYEKILAAITARDQQDRENPVSPLVPAPDACIIHTDSLSIEAVLARLEQLATTCG